MAGRYARVVRLRRDGDRHLWDLCCDSMAGRRVRL